MNQYAIKSLNFFPIGADNYRKKNLKFIKLIINNIAIFVGWLIQMMNDENGIPKNMGVFGVVLHRYTSRIIFF